MRKRSNTIILYLTGCMSKGHWQLIPRTKWTQKKITKPIRAFSCRLGSTYSRIDDLYICPPNIILVQFRVLVIPYSWDKGLYNDIIKTFYKHILLFIGLKLKISKALYNSWLVRTSSVQAFASMIFWFIEVVILFIIIFGLPQSYEIPKISQRILKHSNFKYVIFSIRWSRFVRYLFFNGFCHPSIYLLDLMVKNDSDDSTQWVIHCII